MPSLLGILISILRIGHLCFRMVTQRPCMLGWVNLKEGSALLTKCAGRDMNSEGCHDM